MYIFCYTLLYYTLFALWVLGAAQTIVKHIEMLDLHFLHRFSSAQELTPTLEIVLPLIPFPLIPFLFLWSDINKADLAALHLIDLIRRTVVANPYAFDLHWSVENVSDVVPAIGCLAETFLAG